MRILVVQESNWLDRGPHQSHHLLERMVERGHEVRVIDFDILWRKKAKRPFFSSRTVFSATPKAIAGANIMVIRPPIIHLPVLEYLSLLYSHRKEIIRQLDEFKPDIIIGFGILNARIAITYCDHRNIPFIYYIIDELHQLVPQPLFRKLAYAVERKNMQTADFVLSINEGLRDYSMTMGASRDKIAVIRAGVNLDLFSHTNRQKKREELGIRNDDIVLFFMGWLYTFSGLNEVTESLVKANTDPRFKLLVVGNGDLWDNLQKEKRNPSLEGKILTVGWQPYETIPDFIAAADICLLPAQKNDIMNNIVPIKMYEYMAAGKPVIATNLSGIVKEFGIDNGVIYIERSEDAIMKAGNLLDADLRREYGDKARRFVETNDWNSITTRFEKTLESVIHAG